MNVHTEFIVAAAKRQVVAALGRASAARSVAELSKHRRFAERLQSVVDRYPVQTAVAGARPVQVDAALDVALLDGTQTVPGGGDQGDGAVLSGYAVLFYDARNPEATQYDVEGDGSILERIAPRSFGKVLRTQTVDPRLCWQHDSRVPLASVAAGSLTLTEDERGLRFRATLGRGVDYITDAIERGVVRQMSFGFLPDPDCVRFDFEGDDTLIATLTGFRTLLEISPVTWPAFTGTTVEVERPAGRSSRSSDLADASDRAAHEPEPAEPAFDRYGLDDPLLSPMERAKRLRWVEMDKQDAAKARLAEMLRSGY